MPDRVGRRNGLDLAGRAFIGQKAGVHSRACGDGERRDSCGGTKVGPSACFPLMAVYTEVSDEALATFLTAYDIGAVVAFQGIAEGVENSNYSLRTTEGDFILTLYEKRVDPAELPWFLGLMEHLANRGVRCPRPVAGRDGESLRRLAGRHATVTTFLPGVWPRRVEIRHCAPVGAALAGLHVAGADFAPMRTNTLGPGAWARLLAASAGAGDAIRPGLGAELEAIL